MIANITVGNNPSGIAYDPDSKEMYVTNYASSSVSVINATTHQVEGNPISVGYVPVGIAYDPVHKEMYVANENDNTVSVIATSNHTVVATISMQSTQPGSQLYGIAYILGKGEMYVTSASMVFPSSSVSVINTSTNTVVATLPGVTSNNGQQGIVYDPDNGKVYVASTPNIISVINASTHQMEGSIAVGGFPWGIAYDLDNEKIYVTNLQDSTVSVIDTFSNTVNATIPVGSAPWGIAYDSNNDYIYVTNANSNTVSVIEASTNSVIGNINVGPAPRGIAYDLVHHYMYVTNFGGNTISIIATTVFPYNSTITSAVDSDGHLVTNGSSAISTSITFNVLATQGTYNIAGFQCSIDNGSFTSCSTPNTNPTTITYNSLQPGQHVFKVRAVDSQGNVDLNAATFSWFIVQQQQILPIANAGSNQVVQSSQIVHLDGSSSYDPSGFTPLTYNWTQTSGPQVLLSNPTSTTPSFIAPNVNQETTLTFQLIVTNSKGVSSNPSSVTIIVTPSSSPITPSPSQNGSSISNSNINSFNNDRFSNHNTTISNSNVNSFNNNGHNTYLNHQSQNLFNLQNPMCLTVFGSCDASSGKQSQNMYNGLDK